MQAQSSMLFAVFVSCPIPLAPTCMTLAPNADSTGFAFSNASALPPQKTVSVPASAAGCPSTTGVSKSPMLLLLQMASSSRAVSGEVELEMQDHRPFRDFIQKLGADDHILDLLIGRHHDDDDLRLHADIAGVLGNGDARLFWRAHWLRGVTS